MTCDDRGTSDLRIGRIIPSAAPSAAAVGRMIRACWMLCICGGSCDRSSENIRGLISSVAGAARGVDFRALLFERVYPFVNRGRRLRTAGFAAAPFHVSDGEEVSQLSVAQLIEQAGQERPAFLADLRITERAGARLGQMSDAFLLVAPDRRRRPLFEIHTRGVVAVEVVRVSERQADVVDHQKRLRARPVVVETAWQALKPLLLGLVVGVLNEDREQLERVALMPGRAALRVVDEVELGPAPAVRLAVHFMATGLEFYGRDREFVGVVRLAAFRPRIVGAAMADHSDWIRVVGAESERPEQSCREDAAFDFAVAGAIPDLDDATVGQGTVEFLGTARLLRRTELAVDDLIRSEGILSHRSCSDVHFAHARRGPHLGRAEEGDTVLARQRAVLRFLLFGRCDERMSCDNERCEPDGMTRRHLLERKCKTLSTDVLHQSDARLQESRQIARRHWHQGWIARGTT